MDFVSLQVGDTGNAVKILQEKLKILGFYNAVVTGIFGVSTEVGVRAFQKEFGLEETGIVDQNMWELLFQLTTIAAPISDNPVLRFGDSGS